MTQAQSKPINDAVAQTFSGILNFVQSLKSNTSYKRAMAYGLGAAATGAAGVGIYKYFQFKRNLEKEEANDDLSGSKRPKARLNKQFFKRLKLLLSIVVPSIKYVPHIIFVPCTIILT